ncbi:glycosyltransferase [Gammaproteobacteria bacterium AB-CW1]|uniref:Glycosyltransferase n=1 Tax=Natronospira elongata TaxID=3110268 RepID=A0AAP6MMU0_9GAMM|nr:glycosyltransferase [Gammaproteobacteria bacterium AB-CW1]
MRRLLPSSLEGLLNRLLYYRKRKHKRKKSAPAIHDPGTQRALRADRLESKLWGGYASYAVEDLERLRKSTDATPAEAVQAARALARYYAAKEDHETAVERLSLVRTASPKLASNRGIRTLEVHCLIELGQFEQAHFLLDKSARFGNPNDPDVCAGMAGLCRAMGQAGVMAPAEANQQWLEWMNRPFRATGFLPLAFREPDRGPVLDNLTTESKPATPASMPEKVSVLMAAFEAEDYIETAIRSILEQSWQNLEVVVVEDCGSDGTWKRIKALAKQDGRIVPIRHEENQGAYAARNTALQAATGDLVVVNDSDDWAHPQKIEAQVTALRESRDYLANLSFRVRVYPDLRPQPRLDSPHVPVVHNDYSALMLPREQVLEMGGWDPVRFSADAEFVERLRANHGAQAIQKIHKQVPLSVSLYDGKNLTASSATSIWTNRFGSRKEYMAVAQHWHREERPTIERSSLTEPFPVPPICYQPKGTRTAVDIVLASDFRLPGGTTHCNIEYIRAFRRMGLTVGLLSWPRYELHYEHDRNEKIAELVQSESVIPIVHGDEIDCELLLIHHPPVAMWQMDAYPDINARHVAVIANQSAQRVHGGANDMYEPKLVNKRLKKLFGRRPVWIPISPLIRRLLKEDPARVKLSEGDWLPMIDTSAWSATPTWRGEQRSQPVVGRHSRDQWTKWPGDAEDTRRAYCAGEAFPVRLLGGADTALQQLGERPDNWTVLPFDGVPATEFVRELDFFLHFIHEDSIEAFGRNIVEAMAAGVPVICSPSFRECFGDAAVYAEPAEVKQVIEALWNDKEKYLAQAYAGIEFAERECRPTAFPGRFRQFMTSLEGQSSSRPMAETLEDTE